MTNYGSFNIVDKLILNQNMYLNLNMGEFSL